MVDPGCGPGCHACSVDIPKPRLLRLPVAADAVGAALLLWLGLTVATRTPTPDDWQQAAGLALAVLLPVLVLLRRRHPDATTAAAILLAAGQLVSGSDWTFSGPGYLVFAFTGAALGSRRTVRAALAAALLGGPLLTLRQGSPMGIPVGRLLLVGALLSVPAVLSWVWGRRVRARREYLAGLEARLAHESGARAERVAEAERARIVRELHDVVAHDVSLMIVQAAGAARVLEKSPGRAREALDAIACTGRQAQVEMRRLLGLLRTAEPAAGEYLPQPGLADLPELLEQVREAGLPVEFASGGEPRELPRGVELTVCRIVEEALANTRRHAGPRARARVAVEFGPGAVVVLVEDDGRGRPAGWAAAAGAGGDGHGLVGMRERVDSVNGTLEAGPAPGGGYRVRAVLPLGASG